MKEEFMKKIAIFILPLCLCLIAPAFAGLREDLESEALGIAGKSHNAHGTLDSKTVIAGLKEALSVGTKNGVKNVAQFDGYFGNNLIKILVPAQMQKIAEVLRDAGLRAQVDQFELSMNRAAEKAAPQARVIFIDAIKKMTIQDAEAILRGGDMAATKYLKSKTYDRIHGTFKPIISSAMNDVGVTRYYKELTDTANTIPLLKEQTVDINDYVTSKALDGLFLMVGKEEQRIRKDPAARVTELLRTVFN